MFLLLARLLANLKARTYQRVLKWIGFFFLALAMLMLIRVGYPFIAAFVGGFFVLFPKLLRLWKLIGVAKMAHGYWRSQKTKSNTKPSENISMTTAQAAEILGLSENASSKDIKARHKELMKQIHPDKGGSTYLATQLNEARKVLLNQQGKQS
jgi:hypothetical protein